MDEDEQGTPREGSWLPPAGGGSPGQPPRYEPPPPPPPPPSRPAPPTQPGWQPQQGYQQQPYGQQQWPQYYSYPQVEPDNSAGVGGFVTSVISLCVLVFSFGLGSPLSLIMSVVGIFVSRAGVKKVERGETRRAASLSKWGFWLGVVGTVLSVMALTLWIVALINDPNLFDEDSGAGDPALLRSALPL